MEMVPLIVLLVSATSSAQSHQGEQVNAIFDLIMGDIKNSNTTLESFKVVTIPNLVKTFDISLYFTKLSSTLTATTGTLTDMTTLHRDGNVTMTKRGKSAFFSTSLKMDVMKIVFGNYTLKIPLLNWSGDRLAFDVKKNAFDVILEVHHGRECNIKLKNIIVKEFSDIQVDITGFGIFNAVSRKIVNLFPDLFSDYIIEIAETYPKAMMNHTVEDGILCSAIFESRNIKHFRRR